MPLEQLQREFFAALHLPLRGTSRLATDLPASAEGHSMKFLETAERLIKPGPALSSAERLELYHRQYWYRLLDSIAEDFPVLRRMLGEERFWKLMEDYLLVRPSGSFTLRHLGSRLAEFAAGWEGASPGEQRWFFSLARLEYARMEVFERAELPPLRAEELASSVLVLQPHVLLLDLPAPADLCDGWETFQPQALGDPGPARVAVWRDTHSNLRNTRLAATEAILLDRLSAGSTLEGLFAEAIYPEPTAGEVTAWFASWQERGWIAVKPGAEPVRFVRPLEDDAGFDGVDKMGSQAVSLP